MPDIFDEIQQASLDVRPKDRKQVMANEKAMQSIAQNAITPTPPPKTNVFVEIDNKARQIYMEDRAQAETGRQVFAEINESAIIPSEKPKRDVYGEINAAALSVDGADTEYIDTGGELFADINDSALADPVPRGDVFGEISDFVDADVSVRADAVSGLAPASSLPPSPPRHPPTIPSATGGFSSQAPKPAKRTQGRHPFLSRAESRRR